MPEEERRCIVTAIYQGPNPTNANTDINLKLKKYQMILKKLPLIERNSSLNNQ